MLLCCIGLASLILALLFFNLHTKFDTIFCLFGQMIMCNIFHIKPVSSQNFEKRLEFTDETVIQNAIQS